MAYDETMSGVIAYHIVLTCYGFWLPNDPRGSWSTFVRAFEVYQAGGDATKVHVTRSVAGRSHDHNQRLAAKRALKYTPVQFNGRQARVVMQGIGDYATRNSRQVFAAAVMPDHVHLVVGRSEISAEKMAEQFKARATRDLKRAGLHPFANRALANGRLPSPWSRHAWQVYLNDAADVHRAIRYVQQNPIKAGMKPQRYSWVVPYDCV